MNMYVSGELEQVMDSFEKTLNASPIYTGGTNDRADKTEVPLENGRYSYRYLNNNYYNNGNVNNMFILYLHGYSAGKCSSRL